MDDQRLLEIQNEIAMYELRRKSGDWVTHGYDPATKELSDEVKKLTAKLEKLTKATKELSDNVRPVLEHGLKIHEQLPDRDLLVAIGNLHIADGNVRRILYKDY